jgi:hypothetical protein
MKVNQLRKGMLLAAAAGNILILHKSKAWFRREKEEGSVVVCSSVSNKIDEGLDSLIVGPVIYLGWNFDRFVYDGVYKHHRVLAGDTIALVSGYRMKNFAQVIHE